MHRVTLTSSGTISAKIHAKYGRRLQEADYAALLACHSVGEVASYLKTRTVYGTVLADVNEATVHRGLLEDRLRSKSLEDLANFCRYDTSSGDLCTAYVVTRGETEQLLQFLEWLSAGEPEQYRFSLPLFFSRHAGFDLSALSHVQTYDDLLELLKDTPYHALLAPFSPAPGQPLPLPDIETALQKHHNQRLCDRLSRIGGTQGQQLRQLFGTETDLNNIQRILRLKNGFDASPDAVGRYLIPGGTLSDRQLQALVQASSPEEMAALLQRTPLRHTLPEDDTLPNRHAVLRLARHHLHFSSYSAVKMAAYFLLTDIELSNIVTVIEGVRYGLDTAAIRSLLIL